MAINQTADEAEIQRTAIYAYDPVAGKFRVVKLDASGAVVTAGGGGGGGGAITSGEIARATAAVTTTGQYLTTTVAGYSTVIVDLTGATFAGLAWHFQGSADGTNFFNIEGRVADNQQWERNPSGYGNAQAPKMWTVDVTGYTTFRIDVTAFTSGTATFGVKATALGNPRVVIPTQTSAADLAMTATQGPPGTVANSWRMVVTDLTDIMAVNADGSINAAQGPPGTAAAAWRVAVTDFTDILAINADGSVNVTDNGGSLTVDGTVDVSDRDARLLGRAKILDSGGTVIDPRDTSDRAARLVGVVYGSQGQQLKQTATNFNLQAELAVGATLIDPRDVSDRAARLLGVAKIVDTAGTNQLGVDASNRAKVVADLNAGTNRIGSVRLVDSADADLTSAKDTQTSRMVGVQSVVDAGRTKWQAGTESNTTLITTSGTANTEVAATLGIRKGDAAQTTGSSYTVTSGKKLRLTAYTIDVAHSAAGYATFRIRLTTTLTGNILFDIETRAQAAAGISRALDLPDGFEFAAGQVLQFSTKSSTASLAISIQLYGFEY